MAGILFAFGETLHELASARGIARSFLANDETVFNQLRTQLEGLRDEPTTGRFSWVIPPERPLRTIVSEGEYERSRKGRRVIGTLSFVWEIARVHPKKRRNPAQLFRLVGKASTVIRVVAVQQNDTLGSELAMWRTEVGDAAAPGTYFHFQVLGEGTDPPFPKDLSVPRLPSCFVTPMVTLEFMLAELFQERWHQHVFSESNALKQWRRIQRDRLVRLLAWQSEVASASDRSPWAALKAASPPPKIFID